MKKALRPSAAPLKSSTGETITDRSKQMDRWAEHYQDLYLRESVVTEAALNSIPSLPVMEELDTPPTEEELSKAIDSLARGKAPGGDGIPSPLSCTTSMSSSVSAGRKDMCPKTCAMQESSPSTRTRVIAATVTTTEGFRC